VRVWIVVGLVVALGVAGVVAGGMDDSPGFQLLCLLLIIGSIGYGVRTTRRRR
jgi:hypothetical protein